MDSFLVFLQKSPFNMILLGVVLASGTMLVWPLESHRSRSMLELVPESIPGNWNAIGNGKLRVRREQRLAVHVRNRGPQEPIFLLPWRSAPGREKQALEITVRRQHTEKIERADKEA